MFLLGTALFLGFLHGLGADHLMAIAALSVDGRVVSPSDRRARALSVAVRFACGHALLLSVGAGLIVLVGWSIPVVVERGGEMLGGALLVGMGAVGLWGVLSGRVYAHSHTHEHEVPSPQFPVPRQLVTGNWQLATHDHHHWHMHVGRPDHHPQSASHSHAATIIGAAFAISSLRALAMLTPFGAGLGAAPVPLLLGLIVIFAVGILLSMSLFGVALAHVLSARALGRVADGAGLLVGAASMALGVAWIVAA